jgi:hypothetical protein
MVVLGEKVQSIKSSDELKLCQVREKEDTQR